MIHINRNRVPKPDFFSSEAYKKAFQELKMFFERPIQVRTQMPFPEHINQIELQSLYDLFDAKCAYCESKVSLRNRIILTYDRFRPSNTTLNFNSKDVSDEHYWWLANEWENLYSCCSDCKRQKSNYFPVVGQRAVIKTPYKDVIKQENAILIDPCNDYPDEHFAFFFDKGQMYGQSERANLTIRFLDLNRKNLVEARKKIFLVMSKQVSTLLAEMKSNPRELSFDEEKPHELKDIYQIISEFKSILENTSKSSHLLFRKTLLTNFISHKDYRAVFRYFKIIPGMTGGNAGNAPEEPKKVTFRGDSKKDIDTAAILESMSFPLYKNKDGTLTRDDGAPKTDKYIFDKKDSEFYVSILKNVYLDKVVLKNFKCFSDITINFADPIIAIDSEPWLVFLGENGVGKSSLLKAIALALMGKKYLKTLAIKVEDILKYGETSGFIQVYGKGNDEVYEVTFNENDAELHANIDYPPAFLIAYGATRLLPIDALQPEKDHPNYLKAKNLFNPSISLTDAKSWLLNTEDNTFIHISRTLRSLLLLNDDDRILKSEDKKEILIRFAQTNETININHLSDGYKSIFALAIDIIFTLSKEHTAFQLAEAIVLIDEIGTHLHPRWKMEVVERLRKAFPKIQFIVTTHEPLCLKGLRGKEVTVLKRDEQNVIYPVSDLPDPSSLRVDQLLTSEFFGLNSTMDAKTEKLFNQYYKLLAIPEASRTPEQITQIEALKKDIPPIKHIGSDTRETLIYQVVDEMLSKKVKENNLKIITPQTKQATIDRVKKLLKNRGMQ